MKCPECNDGNIRTLETKKKCPCCGNHPFVCDKYFTVFEAPHERDITNRSENFELEELSWASEDFRIVADKKGGRKVMTEVISEFPTIERYFRNKSN